MDEDTKDYSELPLEVNNNEEISIESELEKEEIIEKKSKVKTIVIIILSILLLLSVGLFIYYFFFKKDSNEPVEEPIKITEEKIERPDDNNDYIALKQSSFGLTCQKTKDGKKIKKLTKGIIIDCELTFDLNQNVKELYFDLTNSQNIKIQKSLNETSFKFETDSNTYKFETEEPTPKLESGFHLYYEVLSSTQSNGFIEMKNIVFADDKGNYYKVLNNLITFPPEYDDKIYIYKTSMDEEEIEVYYYASKSKYEEGSLYDTFQCNNETCVSLAEYGNYFLIKDDNLFIYDISNKSTISINTPEDFNVDNYEYEVMIGKNNKLYGITLWKPNNDTNNCNIYNDECFIDGVSGSYVSYYSITKNMFTIALDYGFIGNNIFDEYDRVLLLYKDNKIGIYSYETDEMIIDMTNKYKSATYNYDVLAVELETTDKTNNENYYIYYNPVNNNYSLDTNLLKQLNTNVFYYTKTNRQKHNISMLFNSKGEQINNLPYVLNDNLIYADDDLIVKQDNYYYVYDINGNHLYKTIIPRNFILEITNNYLVVNNSKNLEIHDKNGNKILNVINLKDGISFISANESDNKLLIYVKDETLENEEANGYKFTYIKGQELQKEEIKIE